MQNELISPGNATQPHQWISFVEGAANSVPNESSYPVHVLGADHNLNNISGGDPTEGFSPWVTDILVYPTFEYWEGLLNGDRIRPYVDLSISEYNTLRIPSAVSGYDLYVDSGRFYEDVTIDGGLNCSTISIGGGGLNVDSNGDIEVRNLNATGEITGVSRTSAPILQVTSDITFDSANTGYIYQSKPSGSNLTITLPQTSNTGVMFTVNNCLAGKTTTFSNLTNARGTILGEQFSSATIYWDGSAWYGIGDLV